MDDIYQFAIDFEQENQEFYRECADNAENERLKNVFVELAQEEEKHEKIVRELAEERVGEEEVESDIVPRAREAFEKIVEDFQQQGSENLTVDQVDIYREAQELEQKSSNFYTEKAEETDQEDVREVFEKLAAEEKKHEEILENIIEMVNKPQTWLDDPEWYHLDEY
ncbi:ferritin-like domain-containing protein [Halarsenatibacter silvermanii]|uniref:Rubrerythrin n=1 Tax=Halarsenatibacter silvermanii TaxID=321763 RepID=A0A1G9LE66_9FIRM|nr:ferritin family protein [Halarsenatibacter silvermanii]SDL60238.1 Rubrerythrin [Halarsenatibacter silvermanii]